ncbi:MAG TPA: bifunctional 23S rRNA (guanine(2069)-N(7))-methyltransferase RlmK/23S rRNA (guanine(2445)-N(2))-methyltransferase RlmL [Nevskiaceae bacterium]|nr:bifunctional 23S rRNA (guanine(2069)-N(7))-methyltransferase RlmK/23S rRNA (guanine(2445)-N(2))-methyltransferase RlmL [Nevskiaceae bacterium]
MSEALRLFISCPRGIEAALVSELTGLGLSAVAAATGGVSGQGSLETAYRICLWSRLASRVLLPLREFPLSDAEGLYAEARQLDWTELFAPDRRFAIEVAGSSPQLPHTHYAGLKVKDAVVDRFRERHGSRPDVDTLNPDLRLHLHLGGETATLSLDLAGDALHRRGWRQTTNEAPLKENLAAAILHLAGWPAIAAEGGGLVDPLCGSGTLVIEAGLMAGDIAPGLTRPRYGFEAWLDHRPVTWARLLGEARERAAAGRLRLPPLAGSDRDAQVLKAARKNAERAGLGGQIQWREADFSQAQPVGERAGLVVTNPPYGERLGHDAEVVKLYSLLGPTLKQRFPGWQAAVFTGRPELGPRLGLSAHARHPLYNGRIPARLLCFQLQGTAATPAAEGAPALIAGGGGEFANRLRKNLAHLGKWARRRGVSNYRLYDADLPAYALAIDLYQSGGRCHAHVQEYAPPKTIEPATAERRLREALLQIQQILELPSDALHYKLRRRQAEGQYTRQAGRGEFLEVEEHGCRLWVNLEDYLDTGLFLDHRPLRLRLQQEAAGKRLLNLFCYTASASVHAAVGGAERTLSVDLSNTYLEWAERNFALNGHSAVWPGARGPAQGARGRGRHELLRADCLRWLEEQAGHARPAAFDLIFFDPPTFSHSKKMEDVLDIQRDHPRLIQQAMSLLLPGGTLYFSCNRHGFKLEAEALSAYDCRDITAQTLDEDFRRPPPAHRAWMIRHR